MAINDKDALAHAWSYFQLHAAQRVTVFNFFVATSGLLVAALAFALRGGSATAVLSIAAGLGLFTLSLIFWKLDERVSEMIKVSEDVIRKIEAKGIAEVDHRVMCREKAAADQIKFGFFGNWTYGQAFRRIFFALGAVGIAGAVIGACQLLTCIPKAMNPIEQNDNSPAKDPLDKQP